MGYDVKGSYECSHGSALISLIIANAAGEGCPDPHMVPCDGRHVRDDPLATEQDLRQVLIDMIPIPGQANAEGGELMRSLLLCRHGVYVQMAT